MANEIYRKDDLFHLSLEQHAALAIALNVACRRCNKQEKDQDFDICMSETFQNRYYPVCKSDDERKERIKFFEELQKNLSNLRNYFSHYLHSKNNLEELGRNDGFSSFLEKLRLKALEVWNFRFKNDALFVEMQNFSIGEWQDLKKYLEDKQEKGLCLSDVLLFVSIFVTQGDMNRLLDIFIPWKKGNPREEKKIKCYREILSALCLRESYDFWSVDKKAGIALSILNHFALITGQRKNKDDKSILSEPISPQGKEKPEICRRFSSHFFIKMMVAFIEHEDLLEGITFARSYNGMPDDGRKENGRGRELYIRHNNTAISFFDKKGQKYYSQLGINALKYIVLAGLGGQKGIAGKVKGRIIQIIGKENVSQQKQGTEKLKDRVKNRINEIEHRFFLGNLSDHQKAVSVLWFLNLIFPVKHKFGKQTYQDALQALTGKYDKEAFMECLPDIPCSETPFPNRKKPAIWAKGANSLDGIFNRVYSLLKDKKKELEKENLDEHIKGIGKYFDLRYLKEKTERAPIERFKNHKTPRLNDLRESLFQYKNKDNYKEIAANVLKERDKEPYSYNQNGAMTSWAKNIYDCDCLLWSVAHKILQKIRSADQKTELEINVNETDYSYTVFIHAGTYRLEINSAQVRRSHVSLNMGRIKNIIQKYWVPGTKTVPFVVDSPNKRKKGEPPRSWKEAETDMERERQVMVETFLKWEKYMANECAKKNRIATGAVEELIKHFGNEPFVKFETLCTKAEIPESLKYIKFRNWTFHQCPEEAFHAAPDKLGELFKKRQEEQLKKRKDQKTKACKNNQRK